jgi:hypothetical protein
MCPFCDEAIDRANWCSGASETHTIFALMSVGLLSIIVVIYLLVGGYVQRAFRSGSQGM